MPIDAVRAAGLSGRFCRIGEDAGTAFCVKLDTGEVWSLPIWQSPFQTGFVNSSLRQFVEGMVRSHILETNEPPDYRTDLEVSRAFKEFVTEQLRVVDPAALDHPRSIWPEVLEDLAFPS